MDEKVSNKISTKITLAKFPLIIVHIFVVVFIKLIKAMGRHSDLHRGVDSESKSVIIAEILKEISIQFNSGNITQDQRVCFKERALQRDPSRIDLHVLLTEVKVYEEAPEVGEK